MSTKTKTTAAAAIAALTLPAAALAHDGEKGRGHDKQQRSEQRDARSERGDHGKRHGWKHGRRAFVLAGVDATGLTVTDGKLAGELTIDPLHASKGARRLLELSKDEIRGEDTVSFGTAGDEVRVKYKGLPEGEAPKPTDIVTVFGKIERKTGELDIKKIWVKRRSAEKQAEQEREQAEKTEKTESHKG
jgi:hypothetical protein